MRSTRFRTYWDRVVLVRFIECYIRKQVLSYKFKLEIIRAMKVISR